jgi:hypothetical protein
LSIDVAFYQAKAAQVWGKLDSAARISSATHDHDGSAR